MCNIIFLDIDGVLNSDKWRYEHEKEIKEGILIDAEKIHLLGQLVENTDAKIVLHSGWKFWFDMEMMPLRKEAGIFLRLLREEGIYIEDCTPDLTTEEIRETKKFSLVKADEILKWLSEHTEVKNWVVLDDLDLNHIEIAKHQIRTNGSIGLTWENIIQAEKMLLGNFQSKN